MSLIRLVVSDFHLGEGSRKGEHNPMEDFFYDDKFAEFIDYHLELAADGELELVLNGDIFDLLKIQIDGAWPIEITESIAVQKLRKCMDGHPRFMRALRDFMRVETSRITYLPGNHDLDMWFEAAQRLFCRYVSDDESCSRIHFVTDSDTYFLPEGIQIKHGHQYERIHRVDYRAMTRENKHAQTVLAIPWGSLWILEVMNPMKMDRNHVDRIQPLNRFLWASLFFDPKFVFRFTWYSARSFLKHRVFRFNAWRDRIRFLPRLLREELFELTSGYDERAARSIERVRGAHTLIIGHSHGPRYRQLADKKLLINTGTWVRMINLDLKHLGQASGLTYAMVDYDNTGKPRTQLMRWNGTRATTEAVPYTD